MNQMTHDLLEEYRTVIQSLTGTVGDIARAEEAKTTAASERKHELLDGCIQEEQACLLKLRGLEQRRMKLQESLGWGSFTLRQILEAASVEQTEALAPLFDDLEQQLTHLQRARETAEQILRIRLHELEAFSRQGMSYDNGGNATRAGAPPSRITNRYV